MGTILAPGHCYEVGDELVVSRDVRRVWLVWALARLLRGLGSPLSPYRTVRTRVRVIEVSEDSLTVDDAP